MKAIGSIFAFFLIMLIISVFLVCSSHLVSYSVTAPFLCGNRSDKKWSYCVFLLWLASMRTARLYRSHLEDFKYMIPIRQITLRCWVVFTRSYNLPSIQTHTILNLASSKVETATKNTCSHRVELINLEPMLKRGDGACCF